MPNYQEGKIYTIRCRTDETLIYVGSTTQPLCKRLYEHKLRCLNEKYINILLYQRINSDLNNWYIELHSLYPCSCKNELERKEGEIIREIGTLNTRIPNRTKKERYDENKDNVKKKSMENYYKNKDKINEYKKNKITCECGCEIRIHELNRHRKSKKHIESLN